MKEKICPVCGKLHTNPSSNMCYKHYSQIKKYGKIMCANSRTIFDMNEIRVCDGFGEVDTYDQFGNVLKTFKFDLEDMPVICKHKWQCVTKGKDIKSYYLVTTEKKQRIYFHRLIMGNPIDEIDHINIDSTDNRKTNLRLSNRTQQLQNTRKRKSVSDYKGVYKNNNRFSACWHAELQIGNKRFYSNWYNTENEAIFARYIMEQRFNAEVYQNEKKRQEAIDSLTQEQKNIISNCLLNKWKH
jgi:hypothetical protein